MATFYPGRFSKRTRTLSVTSGKGGVGKSTLVANLAMAMARRGQRVLILDGDLGMANMDVMFGRRAQGHVLEVISGEKSLEEIVTCVRPNIYLIPGGSGIYGLNRLDSIQRQVLLDQVGELDQDFDVMLVDTAPGIDDNVLYLNSAAQEILVVVTPDPASITDAYALIKVLNQKQRERRFSILVNMAKDEAEGLSVFRRLSDVSGRFLNVSLDWKGVVPADAAIRMATKQQQLVVQQSGDSPGAQAIDRLAEKLSGLGHLNETKGGIQFFWRQVSGVA